MLFFYAVLSGILFGLFFAFLSTGLNLLFGVLRLVNLAHGEIVMFGAYLAYSLTTSAGLSPLLAVPATVLPALAFGVALYYGAIPRLGRAADPETASLILFFGVSQVLQAVAAFVYSNSQLSLSPTTFGSPVSLLGERLPAPWVVCGLLSIPALGLMFFYLYRSRLGLATRALMTSEEEALIAGINTQRVAAAAFGIGVAFAAASGALTLFMLGGVNPSTGIFLTLTAFTVVVIGSLGNPLGSVVGGLLYGLAFTLASTYTPAWAGMVPYVLMLAVLLVKPTGLLGRSLRSA
ncbi:MAG TPA: branched-chain amino acid ABC transporter permease [Streptosporangiaceae bacterium]